ncbi:MAG: 30S ribosomal protein S16 [Thermostichus sp. DG_1_6_bins_120]
MVKLRLKRYGKKRQPSYRIIAIESKTRREARPLEELGYYNPRTKETVLETASLLKWLRFGAQPTETVKGILTKAGIYNMLAAAEGGVVASIRIPAVAKPAAGIPESGEEPAITVVEPEAVNVAAAPEATAEPGAEVGGGERETPQPSEAAAGTAVENPAEPKAEEAAEA